MDDLNAKDLDGLNLSLEESRDIIEFLATKRNINDYKRKSNNELLQAIKENKSKQKQSKIRKELKELSYYVEFFLFFFIFV